MVFLRGILAVIITLVLSFPLNFIPFVGNLLYSLALIGSLSFFSGSPFYSFPLDRREIDSTSKMILMWKYKWTIIGTGLGFLIISFIPVLGFLSHCFSSVGAAVIFREKILPYIEISSAKNGK
jgi:uncharacterized protein involved in cysteine biosynthesis